VINQVRRALGHAATVATGTEAAPLAGERHEPIVPAAVAVKTRESCGKAPAREELAKLALDNLGQAFPIPQGDRLRAKRLEVILHQAVENAVGGIAWLVESGRLGHAWRARASSQFLHRTKA
jgi:hypothetical protein